MTLTSLYFIDCVLVHMDRFGFGGFPITENGELNSRLVGIVCSRDVDFIKEPDVKMSDIMTTELGMFVAACCCVAMILTTPNAVSIGNGRGLCSPRILWACSEFFEACATVRCTFQSLPRTTAHLKKQTRSCARVNMASCPLSTLTASL